MKAYSYQQKNLVRHTFFEQVAHKENLYEPLPRGIANVLICSDFSIHIKINQLAYAYFYDESIKLYFYLLLVPGTKSSGRPGGNPDIKKYGFKSDRDEPLRSRLQLRVPNSMKQYLDQQDNWQEFVRQAISEKIKDEPLRSRLQLPVSDSMKNLDQQDNWQEFVRQAVSEKIKIILKEFISELLEREPTTIETEILEGSSNGLEYDEIAKKANISEDFCRKTEQELINEMNNNIGVEKINKKIFVLPKIEIRFRDLDNQSHQPLRYGIYTLECLGNLREEGERFFLDGITTEGLVKLAPKVNRNFSGTIWEIIYYEAERIYRLRCLGTKTGERFLNGVTTERRLTLVPRPEDIGAEDELSGIKWKIFPVRDEPHTFRFKCYGSEEKPFYLDGRTLDRTVGLLEQADVGRSGTRWKVELVSKKVLQKVGLENLALTHRAALQL